MNLLLSTSPSLSQRRERSVWHASSSVSPSLHYLPAMLLFSPFLHYWIMSKTNNVSSLFSSFTFLFAVIFLLLFLFNYMILFSHSCWFYFLHISPSTFSLCTITSSFRLIFNLLTTHWSLQSLHKLCSPATMLSCPVFITLILVVLPYSCLLRAGERRRGVTVLVALKIFWSYSIYLIPNYFLFICQIKK